METEFAIQHNVEFFHPAADNKIQFGEGVAFDAAREAAQFLQEKGYKVAGALLWDTSKQRDIPFYKTVFYIAPRNPYYLPSKFADESRGDEMLEDVVEYMNTGLRSLGDGFMREVPGFTEASEWGDWWGEIRKNTDNVNASTVHPGHIGVERPLKDSDITYFVEFKLFPNEDFAKDVFAAVEEGNLVATNDPSTSRPWGERITMEQIRRMVQKEPLPNEK